MCIFNTGCPGFQTHEGYFPCCTESGCASSIDTDSGSFDLLSVIGLLEVIDKDSSIKMLESYWCDESNAQWGIGRDVDDKLVTWKL